MDLENHMAMKKIRIALDGPVSSGKTTVGKKLAEKLKYLFIDTGLMYRGVAWLIQRLGTPEEYWGDLAKEAKFRWQGPENDPSLFLHGVDLSDKLWLPEVSALTSKVATNSKVRTALVKVQKSVGDAGGVVMSGRDIGTVVLLDAEVKFFLDADPETRASRRFEELKERGVQTTLEDVQSELLERDERDSTRQDSPLQPAPDAIHINASHLTADEVVREMLARVRAKLGER